jgi:hypothetical protein
MTHSMASQRWPGADIIDNDVGSWKCAYCNRYPASNYTYDSKTFLWRMRHEQTLCEFIYVRPHWTVVIAGNDAESAAIPQAAWVKGVP